MKKTLAMVLAVLMIVGLVPLGTISAFAASTATVKVESVSACPDSTVDVAISITDNPGIASIGFTLSFDENLTLVSATNGEAFTGLTMTPPAQLKKTGSVTGSCRFAWLGNDNVTENGIILNLQFKVAANAELNKNCQITVTCENGDVLDDSRTSVNVITESGSVKVINYMPGDVDNSGFINMLDVLTLCQFYVDGCEYDPDGYAVNINPLSGDVDASGNINMLDVLMLCQYYVDGCKYDINGYGVKLLPGKIACEHELEHIEAKAAACTVDGNIEYWHCTKCDEYFADKDAKDVISLSYTVIKAAHTLEHIAEKVATYDAAGSKEHWKCTVCHKLFSNSSGTDEVTKESIIIPKLESNEYSIEYFAYGNDEYLAGITIENTNPLSFTAEKGVNWLEDLVVPGYNFEGWYDGQGSAASRITSIPVGTTRNIKLYAKWTKEEYTITFDNSSMNLPATTTKYTVDQKVTLNKPTVDRYVFLGWTTDNDKLVSEIKPGTTGNFTLHSNWTSKRNLTKPVNNLGDPIIIEDTNEGKILFTYEIGQIENVPLYTIKALPSAGGVVSVYTETVTKGISKTDASTVAKAIDHTTTDSTAWTLSEDWNETTHVEDSVLNEHGYDRTTGQEIGKTSSNTYTLTTSEYDNTVVKANEGTVATTTQYNTNEVDSRATWESKAALSVSDTESTKYTDSAKVSAEVGVGYGPVSAKAGASAETSTEISSSTTAGATAETTISHENSSHSKTGTDKVTVADNTKTTTSDKGFSKTSNSSSSSSTSLTKYEEETLSEKIATQYTYGESYAKGGSNSTSAASSTCVGESDQYSTTFTYFESEEKTEGVSYTINGESDGSYRLVRAGIVHVFAVVIYDIANAQYGVTTYAVLDDETYTYIDYSATSAAKFDDNENGVLPFEIPYFVNDYVNGRIIATEGLKYDETTLSTAEYDGNNTSVIIPEFFSVDNKDGTHSAYTVRHLSANTFSGNTELKSVFLSSYIRKIPNSAFAGCTSLQFAYGSEIESIGDYAFDGCTSLGQFKIPSTIKSIGEKAFNGVDSIVVTASNKDVVFGAINSGAKKITINISAIADEMNGVTLEVPDTVEYFELQGGRNTFNGLKIKSDAGTTVLNGITINESTGIPMEISSEALTLNQVTVESPSYVLLLKSNAPTISLYGTSKFITPIDNAVVCRNVTFNKIDSNVSSKLEITGNLLYYGTLSNESLVNFTERGEFIELTADEYDKYIKGSFNISFDANEGTCNTSSIIAYCGMEIGDLPTPTRDYYTFDGWYTEKENGNKVQSTTIFDSVSDITLYAHWTENPLSDWVTASSIPSDAQIVNTKWKYRESKTSSSSSLSGYTPNGSDWKWSDYGSWSSWSRSSVSSSDSRQVDTKTVDDSYYKTQYVYFHYCKSGGYYANYAASGCTRHEYLLDSLSLPQTGKTTNGSIPYYGDGHTCSCGCNKWFKGVAGNCSGTTETRQVLVSASHTEYRYRDRSKIYTYYFYRDTETSVNASEPTGSNISNVVKYVQYRVK